MTVEELIEELKKYPPEKIIKIKFSTDNEDYESKDSHDIDVHGLNDGYVTIEGSN